MPTDRSELSAVAPAFPLQFAFARVGATCRFPGKSAGASPDFGNLDPSESSRFGERETRRRIATAATFRAVCSGRVLARSPSYLCERGRERGRASGAPLVGRQQGRGELASAARSYSGFRGRRLAAPPPAPQRRLRRFSRMCVTALFVST